jgi:hypothetical protein
MTKLIKNWDELKKVPANDRFKIVVDDCCGWIKPVNDEDIEIGVNYEYLSTHTFYGSSYKQYTKLLQKYGFNVELDNWDKE